MITPHVWHVICLWLLDGSLVQKLTYVTFEQHRLQAGTVYSAGFSWDLSSIVLCVDESSSYLDTDCLLTASTENQSWSVPCSATELHSTPFWWASANTTAAWCDLHHIKQDTLHALTCEVLDSGSCPWQPEWHTAQQTWVLMLALCAGYTRSLSTGSSWKCWSPGAVWTYPIHPWE